MRIKRTVVLAALAAAAVAAGVGPAAAAEKPAPKQQEDSHVIVQAPAKEMGTQASGGGGRSHDFTGDGIPDILARSTGGNLRVYPNSGTFNGTATYPSVVTINSGWSGFSWLGSADLNGDGFSDVVATDGWGNLWAAIHSGQFNGTATLSPGLVHLGSGWNINDMVYVYDYNADGFDDLLARRAGTGDSFVYYNNGGVAGLSTFQAPDLFMTGGEYDEYQNVTDVTMDGSPEFIYVVGGYMYLLELDGSDGWAQLGYGWQTMDTILFTDVDNDGNEDLLARRASDGSLFAYRHSGSYAPVEGMAHGTFPKSTLVGTNWWVNNIIA